MIKKETKKILKICSKLLKIPSVTCYEKPLLEYLNKKAKKYGYETKIIQNKYLIIKPKQKNSNYLISAHIDRHGMIKNNKGEIEFLSFNKRKELQLPFNKEDHDIFLQTGLAHAKDNIISYNSKTGKKQKKYKITRFNIDHKKKLVTYNLNKKPKKSEKIFMLESNIQTKENLFSGQIDNTISTAILLYLLKTTNFKQEIIFTTKEEIGESYKQPLHYLQKIKKTKNFQNIITIDTSPYENLKFKEKGFLTLRKGDEYSNYNKEISKKIKQNLKNKKIYCHIKPSTNGRTELGKISKESKNKYNGTVIQLPTTNYHTTYETSTIESLENYIQIIKEIAEGKI